MAGAGALCLTAAVGAIVAVGERLAVEHCIDAVRGILGCEHRWSCTILAMASQGEMVCQAPFQCLTTIRQDGWKAIKMLDRVTQRRANPGDCL